MANPSFTADLALILVDATEGLLTQTRAHVCRVSRSGVRQLVLAINKVDLVGFGEAAVARIDAEFRAFAAQLGVHEITTIPVSGLRGDHVAQRSPDMPWYRGPTLLDVLQPCETGDRAEPFDFARSDAAARAPAPAQVADQFECKLVWMDREPLLPGRRYELVLGTRTVNASITEIKYRLNEQTQQHMAARTLAQDEIGVCNLALEAAVPFEPYAVNRQMGGFDLVDRVSHQTVAAGMLHFALRRSQNIYLQRTDVDKAARAALLNQRPVVLWFTGLSGAGKSSIANEVARRLHALGRHVYQLDGDNLRHGLNRDLGFTHADRVENIRRVAEVARLMVDAGLIVLASFISPFRSERELARSRLEPGEFIEVHVDVPLRVAEARDPKGLYARARRGELPNFTGIDSPYEAPVAPDIHLSADAMTVAQAADVVMAGLRARGLLPA